MTSDNSQYFDDATTTNVANDLGPVKTLAVELKAAEAAVARAEDGLVKAKARLALIQEKQLPELMQDLGLNNFEIEDKASGARLLVSLEEVTRVAVTSGGKSGGARTQDNRPAAYAFLREIGLGGIIKKEIAVNVALRGDNVVKAILADVKEKHPDLDVKVNEKVEPSTLSAAIKRRLSEGKHVPLDVFGVTQLLKANVEVL